MFIWPDLPPEGEYALNAAHAEMAERCGSDHLAKCEADYQDEAWGRLEREEAVTMKELRG